MESPYDGPRTVEPLQIGGKAVRIVLPSDPDRLLDDPRVLAMNRHDDYMPYWAYLWPGAFLLAEAVAAEPWEDPARIDALEIGMERPKPLNLAPYRERLTKRVQYGRKINSLRLPPDYFHIENPKGDKRLFQLMDLQCKALRPESSERVDFSEELREFVLLNIADSNIGLAEAARYFHVSERTLQRRLAEAGTSLADLRDEVRRDLAGRLLEETDLSATEIASRLGYSQPSAFTRSTMRWFGSTPRAYRKTNV